MELLYKNRNPEDKKFIELVCNSILVQNILLQPYSDDFAFIFIEGRNREINCMEDWAALKSTKVFSSKNYPIFCFVNNPKNFLNGRENLINNWRINLIKIDSLNSLNEYSEFCIKKLYFMLPDNIENVVTISPDSMLIKNGWEDKVKNYDYIGAPWLHAPSIEIYDKNEWRQFTNPIRVGNGGGSFRKASFCRYASMSFSDLKLRERGTESKYPTEDLYFSSIIKYLVGKIPSPEEAQRIVIDPMDYEDFINKSSYMFHYFSYKNPWKIN
jgi:hypothetical protein